MRYRLFLFSLSLVTIIICSCGSDDEEAPNESKPILNFLGDSIIEYWSSLDSAFPDYECLNHGWSGKGIETFLGRTDVGSLAGTECVVEIGTNDLRKVIGKSNLDSYVKRYIDVLKSLKAKRIYLFSLLPRNRAKDGDYPYNAYYVAFNHAIEEQTQTEMTNVVYVPIFDAFLKDGEINWEYTYDGLHPNARGYEVMALELRKYLVKEQVTAQ